MPELHLVSRWSVEKIKPYIVPIRDLLVKFQKHWPEDFTLEQLFADINTGAKELWVVFDAGEPRAILLGAFKVTPLGVKRYEIAAYAGELRQSETGLIKHVKRYARKQGATALEAKARPGFRRVLKEQGFSPLLEILTAPLE